MRWLFLLVAVVVVIGMLLFPTAAFEDTLGETSPESEIELSPAEGPNGVYAVPDGDGQLGLDISETNQKISQNNGGSGVNANAVTTIDRIFSVTYTGEESVVVRLNVDREGLDIAKDEIYFYQDQQTDDRSLERDGITLGPSETIHVGLFIDTTGDGHEIENVENFEIHVDGPAGDTSSPADEGSSDTGSSGASDSEESAGEQPPTSGDGDSGSEAGGEPEEEPDGTDEESGVSEDETDVSEDESGASEDETGVSENETDVSEDETDDQPEESVGDTDDQPEESSNETVDPQSGEEDSPDSTASDETTGIGPGQSIDQDPEQTLGGLLGGTAVPLLAAMVLFALLFAAARLALRRDSQQPQG